MKRKYLILFSLSGLILCCDQLIKHYIISIFNLGEKSSLLAILNITYARNNGFAFGLIQKAPAALQEIFFIGIPVFALILIVLIFIKLQDDQVPTSIALTTILGGAIGNLIDRIQHGYVIDFMELHYKQVLYLPPFNLADCSILIGVAIMFIHTLLFERTQSQDSSSGSVI